MKLENNKINWPLVGNKHITEFLSRGIANKNLTGTYIFSGPDNLGKTTIANFFAKVLFCENNGPESKSLPCETCSSCNKFSNINKEDISYSSVHSDLYLVKKEKDKKNISIEQVKELIRSLNMSSFLNSYKIGIIKHAETLSEGAVNALLKTLEEPKDDVITILITSDVDLLPETIASRSKILKFNIVDSDIIYDYLIETHKASRSIAKNFSRACLGRPALAIKFMNDKEFKEKYFERALVFLQFTSQDINERIISINDLMDSKVSGQEAVKITERIIEIWQGITRDLLLLEFSNRDLIQHEIISKELMKAKEKFKINNLLDLIKNLKQANNYLRANVNPRLVLENIAINI